MSPTADAESLIGLAPTATLSFSGEELGYGELDRASDELASRLRARGHLAGDRVAIVAPNSPALLVAMLAAWRVGAVPVPLSARLREFDLGRILADADPAALVSLGAHRGFSFRELAPSLAPDLPALRAWLFVDERGQVQEEMLAEPGAGGDALEPGVGAILYTSGTTGAPKGALVTHASLVHQADALAATLALTPDDVTALPVPGSHAFGLAVLLAAIGSGGRTVLVDAGFSLEPLLDGMVAAGATILHGSPTLFAGLLKARPEGVPGLRGGFVAGAACPPELIERLEETGATVLNLYGMTELGAAACCRPGDPPELRHGSVGRPLPGFEFRADAGEIQVRGPDVTPGYFRQPELTAESFDGDWFRTGDLGSVDPSGYVRISGRAKELAHVGGFNVFPAEVESCLLTHPGVGQVAVVAVPHDRMGEVLKAFVVPVPAASLTPQDLLRFARARIAGYKLPYAIDIVPELPLLASGKPDRHALAAHA